MTSTTARQANNSKLAQGLGRAGMICYGVIHLIVGYLAVRIAFGDGAQQADQRGAIAEVGSTTFGGLILWVLAAGLIAFGLWQFMLAVTGYHWRAKQRTRLVKKVSALVTGIVVIGLGIFAARLAGGDSGGGSGDQQQQELTARLMSLPAGKVLVAVAAAVVIGVGVYLVVKGVRRSFLHDLDTHELPAGTRRWTERLGMIGHIAKGVVIAVVGLLIGYAALTADPGKSGGLDAALRTLAGQPFGVVLLVAIALGLAGYGAYCFAAAKVHKS